MSDDVVGEAEAVLAVNKGGRKPSQNISEIIRQRWRDGAVVYHEDVLQWGGSRGLLNYVKSVQARKGCRFEIVQNPQHGGMGFRMIEEGTAPPHKRRRRSSKVVKEAPSKALEPLQTPTQPSDLRGLILPTTPNLGEQLTVTGMSLIDNGAGPVVRLVFRAADGSRGWAADITGQWG